MGWMEEETNHAILFQPMIFITCKHPFLCLLHYSLSAVSFFFRFWYLFIHTNEEIGMVNLPFYTRKSVSGLLEYVKKSNKSFWENGYLKIGPPELMRLIMLSISAREGISMCDLWHISSSSFCFLRNSSFILLAFNWSSLFTSASAFKICLNIVISWFLLILLMHSEY